MNPIEQFNILIVEDNLGDYRLLQEYFQSSPNISITHVTHLKQALDALQTPAFSVVLLDLSLPDSQGLETFQQIQTVAPDTAIIILTGLDDDAVALQAMRQGAQDYLSKNYLNEPLLLRTLRYAVERKRIELSQQASERFAHSTIDAMSQHIAVLDENGTIIAINKAWRQFAQVNNVDLNQVGVGVNYLDVCDAATGEDAVIAQKFAAGIRAVMHGQLNQFSLEYPCHAPFEQRWFNAKVTRFDGDDPLRLVISHDNITERKLAEIDLKHSEEMHRLVLGRISDSVFITDENGDFTYVGSNIDKIFGYTQQEVLDLGNIRLLLGKITYDGKDFSTTGELRNIEHQITDKYGSSHDLLINVRLVNIDSGTVLYTCRDVTEHKQATTALLERQTEVANHNAQLYQQIQQYTKRLELLHQIDQAILRADDLEAIGYAVLPRLQTLLDVHSVSITLFDLEQGEYRVLATTSSAPAYLKVGSRHKFENLELLDLFEKDEVYIVDDLSTSLHFTATDQALIAADIRSYARIPLIVSGRLLGSINVRATEPHYFTAEKLDIAREVARQIAIAIENTRLLEVEQRRNSELTALHQASLQLTRTFNLERVLDTIIDYTVLLINTNDAHIFLYEDEELTFGAAQWGGKKQQRPIAEPRPEGMTYTVAKTGKRVIIPDMQTHPLYADTEFKGASIGLPLNAADTVIGVMTLKFDASHHFTEQELRLLELFADQAAIALHNSQLYEQIQQHNQELERRITRRTVQLQSAKDRVEAILHNSSDAIILVDKNRNILQTNSGFNTQFRYEVDELFRQSLSTIATSEYAGQIDAVIQDVVDNKTAKRLEVVMSRKDHTTFPVDALFASYSEGDSVGVVCSLRDISLQKQVEDELRRALEKEKELNELKTSFTSIVSHEFRTPLAVILSSADILNNYYDRMTEDRRQQKFSTIIKQVHRLTDMIDDVLMITRSETIGFECNPQSINLIALCKELLEEAQIRHGEVGVTVDFTHPDIPKFVRVDEFLFSHILQNLASNAVKYSHKGGNVYVSLNIEEDELVLQVEDEGIGMPESYKSKLFESFQRASNVTDIQGTGIGLTIVKRAVDAHGGAISVESQEEIGTTFTIKLPVAKERMDEN